MRQRWLRILIVGAVVASLQLAAASTAGASQASSGARVATTRTVSGRVACEAGHSVTGVKVRPRGGSSVPATITHLPNSAWMANYSVSLTTSASSAVVQLLVGCGGTRTDWWSTNSTGDASVGTASKSLSARCRDTASGGAQRCVWWGATALIGMPFNGYWDRHGYSPPNSHHTSGDWSTDLYGDAGQDVYAFAWSSRDRTVELRYEGKSGTCGHTNAGWTVRAGVYVDGQRRGGVSWGHLRNVPALSGNIHGKFLGDLHWWPSPQNQTNGGLCWQVDFANSVHTHFTADNAGGASCWWPHGAGTQLPARRLIAQIRVPALASRGACPD